MIELGKFNTLKIGREVDFGLYLQSSDDEEEVLLPLRYVPEGYKIGDNIDVFIYNDSEDRRIAITEKPLAVLGEFAFLKVVSVTNIGAFLEWGIPKDLFIPFREQKTKMKEGEKYPVYIYIDYDSDRIVASSKLEKFLDNVPVGYKTGEKVGLFVFDKTDLGFKVVIDDLHTGIVYHNEIFDNIEIGVKTSGYIKKVRSDEKIDISLNEPGYDKVVILAERIVEKIKENNGFLPLNDKSDPEKVYQQFQESKKTFKKALGYLYKQHLILMEESGIKFTNEEGIS